MSRAALHRLIVVLSVTAYVWLGYNLAKEQNNPELKTICISKKISDIPCPVCGSTRSMLATFHGDFSAAVSYNPLGMLTLVFLSLCLLWMIADVVFRGESFYKFYLKCNLFLMRKSLLILLFTLFILNWIWSISKGL